MKQYLSVSWTELKSEVYFEDGSLRDIYVRDVSVADWRKWVDFVNSHYPVVFKVDFNGSESATIDFDYVLRYWQGLEEECPSAQILLDGIIIATYFLDDGELENDITPTEVRSEQGHRCLLEYLTAVSKLLGRPVELCHENSRPGTGLLLLADGLLVTYPWRK